MFQRANAEHVDIFIGINIHNPLDQSPWSDLINEHSLRPCFSWRMVLSSLKIQGKYEIEIRSQNSEVKV